jgi:hypothetical protein
LWTTEARGSIEPTEGLQLEGDIRHDRGGQGEAYSRGSVSIAGNLGPTAVRASLGNWFNNPGEHRPEWGLGIGIPIRPRVSIFSTAQHETFDPTFLSSPRTNWNVGLTFRLGRSEANSQAEAPAESTRVIVRVPLREAASAPFIAGDFTNWAPVLMTRYEHEWRFPVDLPSGVYRFAFRNRDGEWFVPPSIPNRADDGMGGWVAVLVVP